MGHNGTDARWDAYRREMEPIEARVEALDKALWERATALSGLGAGRNVWSNALLALADGRPWPEVNYPALRRAVRLDTEARGRVREIGARIRRAVYARHYPERAVIEGRFPAYTPSDPPGRTPLGMRVDVSDQWSETSDADYC